MSQLPAPAPLVTSTTKEFWAGTAEGRFILQRCDTCSEVAWFPRRECPYCWTETLTSFDASGKGFVYTFTIVRKGGEDFAQAAPFVVAYVQLAEGPRVLTNIVDCDVDSVAIGMPVEMVFHDTGKGNARYRFRPAAI